MLMWSATLATCTVWLPWREWCFRTESLSIESLQCGDLGLWAIPILYCRCFPFFFDLISTLFLVWFFFHFFFWGGVGLFWTFFLFEITDDMKLNVLLMVILLLCDQTENHLCCRLMLIKWHEKDWIYMNHLNILPPDPPTLNVCGTVPIWMPFTQVFTLYFCTRAHSMPCVLLLINVWSGHHSAPLKFLSIINRLLWQPTAPWILLNCVSSGRKPVC